MNTKDTEIETIEEATPKQEPKAIEAPRTDYFFPNQDIDLPFGGEFTSLKEAEEANAKYIAKHNKEHK